ncbi:MAG TPA: alpha-amylase family glycosyl hydrolase [Chloroflexota bacterium]
MATPADQPLWWQRGIVYQIYPRSFMDSNADGVGDLRGITDKLDYLRWLGIDAIWISPIYPSPMADFGYDVADYCAIHPLFGTLADFDRLTTEAHARGIRIILDYVPNHTADQHPWFLESKSSRSDTKRDWYIWADQPNNWISVFGGSAWQWEPTTSQYYYHAYLKEQPDLNWHNPDVQHAMLDVLRFWFERGVDGMRIDALRQLVKSPDRQDNPPNPDWRPGQDPYGSLIPLYTTDQPELLQHVARFREVADGYPERVLIGELWLPIERLVAYYGLDGAGLHLPFNFHLIMTRWQARAIAALVEQYEAALPAGAWPNWVLGNHDRSRIATRVGSPQARIAAMLLLTLRGTPTLYQGDELGMHDVPIPPEAVQDPVDRNLPGLGLGRDPERTPMQWDASANAGFCPPSVTPWLPIADDYAAVNVAAQQTDQTSPLSLYRSLVGLRRATPALTSGSYRTAVLTDDVLGYVRERGAQRIMVVLNFAHEPRHVEIPQGSVLLSTYLDRSGQPPSELRADEGLVIELSA